MIKKIRLKDAPDKYGMTEEELEAEYNERRKTLRKQREEARVREDREIKKRRELESKYFEELNIIKNAKNIEDLYLLVPERGKADTLAGELVRAFMRLEYRWYNDGDVFFEGYGYIDTCSAPAAFICKHAGGEFGRDFFEFADENNLDYDYNGFVDYEGMGYGDFIYNLGKNLFAYIKDNPESLMKPTADMYSEDGVVYFENIVPKHILTVEIPTDLRESVNKHEDDIINYFESLFDFMGNVLVGYAEVEVEGLELSDYRDALNWDWEQIWDDIRNEYLGGKYDDDFEEDED